MITPIVILSLIVGALVIASVIVVPLVLMTRMHALLAAITIPAITVALEALAIASVAASVSPPVAPMPTLPVVLAALLRLLAILLGLALEAAPVHPLLLRLRLSAALRGLSAANAGIRRIVAIHVELVIRHAELARQRTWAMLNSGLPPLGWLLSGHDDPVVMLSMLEKVLRHHAIAGGLGIARKRHVLLGYVSRISADLDAGAIALEIAGERVLTATIVATTTAAVTAVSTMTAIPAATTPILLSLPHWAPVSARKS